MLIGLGAHGLTLVDTVIQGVKAEPERLKIPHHIHCYCIFLEK